MWGTPHLRPVTKPSYSSRQTLSSLTSVLISPDASDDTTEIRQPGQKDRAGVSEGPLSAVSSDVGWVINGVDSTYSDGG